MSKKHIKKVKNIVGTPIQIETEINNSLNAGYEINGKLILWKDPESHKEMFVQQLVKYEVK